jgi:hypothetical protein
VPATLHIARYTPPAAGRMLWAMRRRWPALEAQPGMRVARLIATANLDTITGGTPTPTRWALLCGWEDRAARDAFASGGFAPFAAGASECWSVSLDPVRVMTGDFRGWRPVTDGVERLAPTEPLAILTCLRVRPRRIPTFQLNNRRISRALDGDPGHVMRIGLFDDLVMRATFSVWRSLEEVRRFAYGDGVHRPVQRRSREVPWTDENFFVRFRPVASSGTYDRRDPLAELV